MLHTLASSCKLSEEGDDQSVVSDALTHNFPRGRKIKRERNGKCRVGTIVQVFRLCFNMLATMFLAFLL